MKSDKRKNKNRQHTDPLDEERIDALLDHLADALFDKWLAEKKKVAHLSSTTEPITGDNVSV